MFPEIRFPKGYFWTKLVFFHRNSRDFEHKKSRKRFQMMMKREGLYSEKVESENIGPKKVLKFDILKINLIAFVRVYSFKAWWSTSNNNKSDEIGGTYQVLFMRKKTNKYGFSFTLWTFYTKFEVKFILESIYCWHFSLERKKITPYKISK